MTLYTKVFLNTIFYIGIFDFLTFIIPDSGLLVLIGLIVFNFNIYNLFYSIFLFILTLIYWKKGKMGFGDVKLLTVLTLLLGKRIFVIIISSLVIAMIANLIKKCEKIPLGFYLSVSVIIFSFLGGQNFAL